MTCPRCIERGKIWEGSDPKCAFEKPNEFSPKNWNCATANAIRDLFPSEWECADGHPNSFKVRDDDQSSAAIHLRGIELETTHAEILCVVWYKEHGQTEGMWLISHCGATKPSLADCEAIIAAFRNNS